MPTLEMVMHFERLNRNLTILQKQLPELRILTRSDFFIIVGCHIPAHPNEQEKAWIQAMIDARVIALYRCKDRTDR